MPYARNQIQELREQRRKLGEQMREITAKARTEKRDLSTEEDTKFNAMHEDGLKLLREIEREEKVSGILTDVEVSRRSAAAVDPDGEVPTGESPDAGEPEGAADAARAMKDAGKGVRDTKKYTELFQRYLVAESRFAADQIAGRAHQLRLEQRDLSVGSDTQAGFLVPPEQFVMELLKNLDDQTMVRGMARTFQVPMAKSLGVPKRTSKASTWIWGSEISPPAKDTSLAFGKRELHPKNASGLILVSRDFLRQALMGPEGIVREEIARDGSELQENAFLTGSGAGQPLGMFIASVDGISTARDISAGNTTTEVTLTGLRNAKYNLKPAYWPKAEWLGSRTFHKQLYSMDDGVGRPIFVESVRVGEVDRVLSFPVHIDEFAPNTFTTGQYVAMLADFQYYWIADALDIEIQRLDELYALSNQVGFVARLKTDGMPVLEEAFTRVKLG
jgi:HK97 family phage major capsid protein